ncbi:MAG TPA: hypothetical protein VLY03_01305 [Bacteroidota bacterium]|nr:hypothetical protein [Bacteroidota bacterium]
MISMRHHAVTVLSSCFLLFCFALQSPAQILPEKKVVTTITGRNHQTLRKFFASLGDIADVFDDKVGNLVVSLLPKEYRTGCKNMVDLWGKDAKGTQSLAPRTIYIKTMPDSIIHVFVVYTCYSNAKGFGDHYYDERMAVFTVGHSSTTMTMLPFGLQCQDCNELSRVAMYEDTLSVDNAPLVSVISSLSNDNPCCGRTRTIEEHYLHYYRLDPHSVTPVASILDYRKEVNHIEAGHDSTTLYSTNRYVERADDGSLRKIVMNYTESVNDRPIRGGIHTYMWNKKRHAFDITY